MIGEAFLLQTHGKKEMLFFTRLIDCSGSGHWSCGGWNEVEYCWITHHHTQLMKRLILLLMKINK
jgi:hypothetical protein